jgi:signal transduction histidine kinase
MLRSAGIFLAAILLPSLVLAWLAWRSARDQEILLEHQQAIICQDVTDALAKSVRNQIDGVRSEFVQITQDLLSKSASPLATAYAFDRNLRAQWSPAEVGFAVDLHGTIYSPGSGDRPAARTFYEENERFLTNREFVEVYSSLNSQSLVSGQRADLQVAVGKLNANMYNLSEQARAVSPVMEKMANSSDAYRNASGGSQNAVSSPTAESSLSVAAVNKIESRDAASLSTKSFAGVEQAQSASAAGSGSMAPAQFSKDISQAGSSVSLAATAAASASAPTDLPMEKLSQKINAVRRKVSPQNILNATADTLSNTLPVESDFRRLIGDDTSGALARFLDNKLRLLVWYRPSASGDLVFGAQLNQARVLDRLRSVLQTPEFTERDNSSFSGSRVASYCVVLLDDTGQPVATSIPGFSADWKHPFVATEIGESLPHWEAALYLTDPQQISKSARTLRLTVGLIVVLLIVAIVAGGSLIATDVRRQMRLAQQKTDFVSNVSHELKTPLTSIRMFADLLSEGRVTEPGRQATYLKIIAAESARLTRLINNVLDFARQERGAREGERRPCDLVEATRDVVETCLPHLEANGQTLSFEIEVEALPVIGDRDALAQIILNLISNAEKYGGGEIVVRVRQQDTEAGALGCVDVLDRGAGVPPKQAESIFLPFHRLHDSLSNGIPGSGLGLTLARRMARAHRGNITYAPRASGGSCFTLTVPLAALPA